MGHVERGVRCCWGAVLCFCFCSALLCLLKLSACVPCSSVCQPSHISLSMRSSCGYGWVGIHRRLRNSRPRLSPTQLVAPYSLHP